MRRKDTKPSTRNKPVQDVISTEQRDSAVVRQPNAASTEVLLEYAMKHFSFVAEQRMKSFNFYAILFAAAIAATIGTMDKLPKVGGFISCGAVHLLIAAVFFMMDQRSRRLVRLSLHAVRLIEASDDWPDAARLAHRDADEMTHWKNRLISFTGAFNIVFLTQALVGVGIIICGICFIHRW